jgi:hypothetical protein
MKATLIAHTAKTNKITYAQALRSTETNKTQQQSLSQQLQGQNRQQTTLSQQQQLTQQTLFQPQQNLTQQLQHLSNNSQYTQSTVHKPTPATFVKQPLLPTPSPVPEINNVVRQPEFAAMLVMILDHITRRETSNTYDIVKITHNVITTLYPQAQIPTTNTIMDVINKHYERSLSIENLPKQTVISNNKKITALTSTTVPISTPQTTTTSTMYHIPTVTDASRPINEQPQNSVTAHSLINSKTQSMSNKIQQLPIKPMTILTNGNKTLTLDNSQATKQQTPLSSTTTLHKTNSITTKTQDNNRISQSNHTHNTRTNAKSVPTHKNKSLHTPGESPQSDSNDEAVLNLNNYND